MKSRILTSAADSISDMSNLYSGWTSSARTLSGERIDGGSSCAAAYGSSSAGRARPAAHAIALKLD